MSTIKMTKTFEIPVSGDCQICQQKINYIGFEDVFIHCQAFNEEIGSCNPRSKCDDGEQCQACKNFLKAEKSRVMPGRNCVFILSCHNFKNNACSTCNREYDGCTTDWYVEKIKANTDVEVIGC